MTPWEVLGIPSDADKRTIKKAYAKQLKHTRPDDDAKAFQTLHGAYKTALNLADNRALSFASIQENAAEVAVKVAVDEDHIVDENQTEDGIYESTTNGSLDPALEQAPNEGIEVLDICPLENEKEKALAHDNIHSEQTTEASAAQKQMEIAQAKETQKREREFERVIKHVETLLETQKLIERESTWHFIAETEYLLEENFNWNLSLAIFERIAKFNSSQRKRSRRGYIKSVLPPTLRYLDDLFNWQTHSYWLGQSLGEELCQVLLKHIGNEDTRNTPPRYFQGGSLVLESEQDATPPSTQEYYFGGLVLRSFACVLDMFVVVTPIYLACKYIFGDLIELEKDHHLAFSLVIAFPVFIIMTITMDASTWQATLGKRLLGLKVTNKNLQRLGYFHSLMRTLCFLISIAFGKFAWIINCFLRGNLLHDRLSRSHVISIRK